MFDKNYFNNLSDDKDLFDEILPPADFDEDLEEEYLAGTIYQQELDEHENQYF